MSKLEKLDLIGVASLAAVTAALLVAWMVTTHNAASQVRPVAQAPAVTLTHDGSMKLTVTARDTLIRNTTHVVGLSGNRNSNATPATRTGTIPRASAW